MQKQTTFVRISLFVFAVVICTTTLLGSCKEEPTLNSAWRDREIRVDGDDVDWQGCPQYYDENTRTVISILNDKEHLYLRLSVHDQEIQRQMMIQGFTLWLEQQGENPQKIGVHFPVGLPREDRMSSMFRGPPRDAPGPPGPPPKETSGAPGDSPIEGPRPLREFQKMEQREVQLLGPGEYEQRTMPLAGIKDYDIDVTVNQTPKGLVYELKVPIARGKETRYGLIDPGKEGFRLGLQAGGMEEKAGKPGNMGQPAPDRGGGPEGGTRRPRGGGPPGGPGGPVGGGKKDEQHHATPLNLWLKVTALAE